MVFIRFRSVSTCGATELSTQVALDTAPAVRTSPLAMRAGIRAANGIITPFNLWVSFVTSMG